jgi:hypothetical protein
VRVVRRSGDALEIDEVGAVGGPTGSGRGWRGGTRD